MTGINPLIYVQIKKGALKVQIHNYNAYKEKKRFDSISEKRLRGFNLAEIRGWIIDRLIQIEYRIDYIILEFFRPKHEKVFKEIVLNSSIVDFGGKAKILRNIGVSKSTIAKIRRIVSIRNGFSHASFSEHLSVTIKEDEDGNDEDVDIKSWDVITVMNSEGVIKSRSVYDYLSEFHVLNDEIRLELDVFLKSIEASTK